ncbi:coiled-coil domain-containing protein 32-like [Ptychodera flava]|uniref:coiled-coil domain-containing protein 32-like n=1 Tax=Ptychodera flava TaxID=63121 RepID=UPI00396A8C3D
MSSTKMMADDSGPDSTGPWTVPSLPSAVSSDEGFEDTFNPFDKVNSGEPNKGNDLNELESQKYLSSLEAKLDRLKGKTRSPTSKDIVKTLHGAKEDHLNRIIKESTSLDTATISSTDEDEVKTGTLRRRVFPEQPLTVEEVQCLVERDYLNNVTQTMHREKSPEQDP